MACYAGFCARGWAWPAGDRGADRRLHRGLRGAAAQAGDGRAPARQPRGRAWPAGAPNPTRGGVVRDAMRGFAAGWARRSARRDRCAMAKDRERTGQGVHAQRAARGLFRTLPGLRDAHCSRLPMTRACACPELVRVNAEHIEPVRTAPPCSPCRCPRPTRKGRGPMPGSRPTPCGVCGPGSWGGDRVRAAVPPDWGDPHPRAGSCRARRPTGAAWIALAAAGGAGAARRDKARAGDDDLYRRRRR
jgi:hypothetical protein